MARGKKHSGFMVKGTSSHKKAHKKGHKKGGRKGRGRKR